MATRKITVQLIGDSDSLERAFDRAGKNGKQFDTRMGRVGANLKSLGKAGAAGAAVGGIALATHTLVRGIAAAKEAQVAQARLRQGLKASGNSYARYGKQIDSAIDKTSRLAGLDDEELSESFTKLVRTSGSVTKATKGMALAADIARARNISLVSATGIVEKAMIGQFRGLKSVGVEIDENASRTEALEATQRKFAGSAERYGKTAAGAQERFSVALENLQERIGAKLLPVLTKLALWGVRFLDWSEKNWPKFSAVVAAQWEKIRPVFEAFKSYFGGFVKIIQGIITGDWSLAWKGVKQVVSSAFELAIAYIKAVPARFFALGLRIGKALANGVIAGIGNLVDRITDKIPFMGDEGIPPSIQKQIDKARANATAAPGRTGPKTPAKPTATGPPSGTAGSGGPRAKGGPVIAGRSYTVGENGPERLTMGSTSGHVTPNGGGGMSIGVVNVYGVQNVRELMAELQRVARHGVAQQRGMHGGTNLALT